MPPKSKEKNPARITVACNACRSRKQKLRRGPAKGYIENLEHRLQVTESVLLKLLSQASDQQLLAALPSDRTTRLGRKRAYMPFSRLSKEGMDYWSDYPLDTPYNIRQWQQACIGHEAAGLESPEVHSEHHEPRESKRRRVESHDAGSFFPGDIQQGVEFKGTSESFEKDKQTTSRSIYQPATQKPSSEVQEYQQTLRRALMEPSSSLNLDNGANIHPDTSQAIYTTTSWTGAPSLNFQRQFLW
ncbi:hypothetical protein N7510_010857 [Penicillium lagena]|uniref:uncharacterized protein n=1 Tax=Penicillium lagena TaxID=94218 RepID=UPI002541EA32|nr:uncharacterized protein N7510_010857 [Penicillium lagena]KAJ5601323.1 hypothetical protein N7510_010857 [Penicillium lagena]